MLRLYDMPRLVVSVNENRERYGVMVATVLYPFSQVVLERCAEQAYVQEVSRGKGM